MKQEFDRARGESLGRGKMMFGFCYFMLASTSLCLTLFFMSAKLCHNLFQSVVVIFFLECLNI
jgi:hypothetical protein